MEKPMMNITEKEDGFTVYSNGCTDSEKILSMYEAVTTAVFRILTEQCAVTADRAEESMKSVRLLTIENHMQIAEDCHRVQAILDHYEDLYYGLREYEKPTPEEQELYRANHKYLHEKMWELTWKLTAIARQKVHDKGK